MYDLDKLKLSIYEDTTISENVRDILIEEADNNSDSPNKVYIGAYKKAAIDYRKEIKEVKTLIRNHELRQAQKKIKETRAKLLELEKVVNDMPSTMSSTLLSQLAEITVDMLVGVVVVKALEPAFKGLYKHYEKEFEQLKKDNPKMGDFKSIMPEDASGLFKSALLESIAWVGLKDLYKTFKTKDPVSNTNMFKNRVLKKISKEKKILDKLERVVLGFTK